ncbi:MAG: hypothetical protein ABIQ73_24400 [Acidimicrobiales bacterium]
MGLTMNQNRFPSPSPALSSPAASSPAAPGSPPPKRPTRPPTPRPRHSSRAARKPGGQLRPIEDARRQAARPLRQLVKLRDQATDAGKADVAATITQRLDRINDRDGRIEARLTKIHDKYVDNCSIPEPNITPLV